MKRVLTNPKRVEEVTNIHSSIKALYKGLTLEQSLITGYNWKRDKIESVILSNKYTKLRNFFYKWDYSNPDRSLNTFRLYDQPAITRHARYRAVFLQDMIKKGYNLSLELPIATLEEISCYAVGYATIAYAIKCFLLANYSDLEIDLYQGIQPQTGPVANAIEHLYGRHMSNYQHTMLCNFEAGEYSSTFINTAFYTLG